MMMNKSNLTFVRVQDFDTSQPYRARNYFRKVQELAWELASCTYPPTMSIMNGVVVISCNNRLGNYVDSKPADILAASFRVALVWHSV